MDGNFRTALRVLAVTAAIVIAAPVSFAQNHSVFEKSPLSGGVLSARAIRTGKLFTHAGSSSLLEVADLNCSPAPCVFTPVRASPGGQPANENPVAVNPENPLQILSGANDYNCSNIQGYYSSNDGGSTWTHTCSPGTGGEGDPIVAYDTSGNAFAGGIQNNNFVIFTSTDNGVHWSNPITVTTPLLGGTADKPWLEADVNSGSAFRNSLYVSGTQFDSTFTKTEISVSRSTDAGQTWNTAVVDTEQSSMIDQFSDLAVGADGTVYVTWQRCPPTGPASDCGGTLASMYFSKSTDGGATWSSPVVMTTANLVPDTAGCYYGCLPNTGERVANIPSVTVNGSGATAQVFVTYYDYSGGQMRVKLVGSTNGGGRFGMSSNVSSSPGGDQFFPWINVTQSGSEVGVTWLDRRNDPANLKYQPFFTAAPPRSKGFPAARALSKRLSNPNNDGFGGTFMGDYRTHVWSGNSLYAVWMDSTTGTNNMQDEFGGIRLQ